MDLQQIKQNQAGMILRFSVPAIISMLLTAFITVADGFFMGNYVGTGEALSLSVIPWWLALFAIGFSIMIGLLAGVYPANRAVKLSPIEAMRNN